MYAVAIALRLWPGRAGLQQVKSARRRRAGNYLSPCSIYHLRTYIDPARAAVLLQIIVRQQPSCSRSHGCVRPAGSTGRRPATWIRPAPHGHACMCIQFSSHSGHLSRATAHRPAGQQRRRRWQKASGGRRQAQAAAAYV